MRVLLDECLPLDFRHELRGREAHTVQWAGFRGKKMATCSTRRRTPGTRYFLPSTRVYLIRAQSGSRTIAMFVLRSRTNQLEDSRLLVDAVLHVLAGIAPGRIVTIQPSGS
jgi:hypothetical protein